MTNIFSAELDAAVDAGRPNPIARDLAAAVDATDDERAAAAAALTANVADWNAHGRPSE